MEVIGTIIRGGIMENINVEFVQQKTTKNGKPYWIVTYNNGTNASIWDKHLADILNNAKGTNIEVQLERNGDWTNVVGIKDSESLSDTVVEKPFDTPAKKKWTGGGKADPAKLVSIERQATAKMVMGYYGAIGKDINEKKFHSVCEMVYKWIHQEVEK